MPPIAEELEAFMSDRSELEEGKHVAYAVLAEKVTEMDPPPTFCREDDDMVRNDPVLSEAVPKMLNIAAQISVGNREFVLENGPDVMNSSDEDAPHEEHGEELTRMYVNGFKAPVLQTPCLTGSRSGLWLDKQGSAPHILGSLME
jgi:hypothetical protein